MLHNKRWKISQQIILFFSIILISAGMVYGESSLPPRQKLDKVSMQLPWHHEFQFAGYYAAQIKGYYAKEGLDVEIRDRNFNQYPIDAVLSGEADFGSSTSELIYLRMQGKPVVALACIMQHSPLALVMRKDSGITTLEELIGKTIAMEGDYRDAEMLATFKNEGIAIEKMTIAKKTAGVEHLIDGSIDARMSYLSDQPFALREKGIEPQVIRPVNYGIDFYGDTLFTSQSQIKNHPERVRVFRRASLRGWEYAMENPEEIIDYIITKLYANSKTITQTRQQLMFAAEVMTNDLIHPTLVEIGHMNPHRWRHIADTYAEIGMAENLESLEDFIYDPDDKPEYNWLYVTLGLLIGIIAVGTLSYMWHKSLRLAVSRKTSELLESYQKHKRLEQDYQVLFRKMLDGFAFHEIICDEQGQPIDYRFLNVNPAFERMTGLKAKDAIGKTIMEIMPNIEHHWIKTYGKVALTGEPEFFENYSAELNKYFEVTAFSPGINQFACIFADITERKLAEQALTQSEEKHRELTENLPQRIFHKDANSVYISCNEHYARDLGIKAEDIAGKNDFDFYPKELAEKYRKDDQLVMENGNTEEIEESYLKDDKELFVQTVKTPLTDEAGNSVGILGIFWDITDRKQTEKALHESEERFSLFMQHMPGISFIKDGLKLSLKAIYPYQKESTHIDLDLNL
ncbi:MAG: ABC transporter substrate-binding protein [Phycisphaerae bacterium]|nr:ABC transporter substrate-binding protein [Phycisphaerae bacterium]